MDKRKVNPGEKKDCWLLPTFIGETMKIGIVGCGLNADYHINFARSYPGLEILGLVDTDDRKGRVCAERFGIDNVFPTISALVDHDRPDVLHIVTPPKTHFALGKEALELKCNVLIEKPLCLSAEDAKELYVIAERNGVKLCTMHNHYFDPCMLKARRLVDEGKVGRIINVESHYGLNTHIDAFRRYPAPNVLPWIYSMPGGVYHDFMAHPLYVMLPFLGSLEEIQVMEKSFGELPQNISDELRILVKGENALGSLTFSFAAKPHHHFLRIYGTKMMVNVDFNTMTTIVFPVSSLPKAAQKATYNLNASRQLFTGTVANVWNFVTRKLRPYQGMQNLIHCFYQAVEGKAEMPVSREEAIRVLKVMDAIWPRVLNRYLDFRPVLPQPTAAAPVSPRVLVTGATGFLGRRSVEILARKGFRVRALARKLSNIDSLCEHDVEIYFGDVACEESLRQAFKGVDYVIHAAADTGGSEEDGKVSTIRGTEIVLALSQEFNVQKLVYISSCGVYGVADFKDWQMVEEHSGLERFSVKRGHYSHAKLEAERLVTDAMDKGAVPITCLRPGTIYGPGGQVFTPMMGFSLGGKVFAVIGDGRFVLPLVYVDNLVDAIVSAITEPESTGKIYNVVDPVTITKKDYMAGLVKKLYPNSFSIHIPFKLLYGMVYLQEKACKFMERKPFLTRYRLISSQKPIIYDSSKLRTELGWNPPVSVEEAFENIVRHERVRNPSGNHSTLTPAPLPHGEGAADALVVERVGEGRVRVEGQNR
jgi:predicted dehydrogenase/nucleoside-diphosphate-sugar epimerase